MEVNHRQPSPTLESPRPDLAICFSAAQISGLRTPGVHPIRLKLPRGVTPCGPPGKVGVLTWLAEVGLRDALTGRSREVACRCAHVCVETTKGCVNSQESMNPCQIRSVTNPVDDERHSSQKWPYRHRSKLSSIGLGGFLVQVRNLE